MSVMPATKVAEGETKRFDFPLAFPSTFWSTLMLMIFEYLHQSLSYNIIKLGQKLLCGLIIILQKT